MLAKEHVNSSITNEPSINNPSRQVVDEHMMEDLVEEGYNMDEIKDEIDAISLDEEVPVVHPPIQQPDVSETIPRHILSPSTIVNP